jgi:amino acid transporter
VSDVIRDSSVDVAGMNADERRLAEMGYKQELNRSWSGFHNFAISFSIISILAGCFTTFGTGWNGGGPAAIAWGWPLLGLGVLTIGLCLSELVSAYPTSGGIYWWASKLGGAKAGYYTGWLNLIGLLAIVASVAYGCATFFDLTLGFFDSSYHSGNLDRIFLYFLAVLVLAAVVNIFSSNLLAIINGVSVWWHVLGAAAIVLILIFLPDHHSSVSTVFTQTVNNTGFFGGKTSGFGYIFLILPIGALLTLYTITGYDASAHLSEETKSAANSAARGIWQSILYSAIGGWILLLAFLFAVQPHVTSTVNGKTTTVSGVDAVSTAGGGVASIFQQALTSKWGGIILLISTAGQFFCTMACMTSCTRMLFAFSRDGAVPGHRYWSRLNSNRVPVFGVILTAVISVILTLPALVKVDINGAPVPVAFYAVVSIGVIGLYWCFSIPIWQRFKMRSRFESGDWTLGAKYKVIAPLALLVVLITTISAFLPTSNGGVPWSPNFAWRYVNYTILVVPAAMILLWLYWHLSVKKWFTGPKHNIELPAQPAAGK